MDDKQHSGCILQATQGARGFVVAVVLASGSSLATIADVAAQAEQPLSLSEDLTRSLPASIARQRLQKSHHPSHGRRFDKILNGRDAKKGEFPWQVALIHADTPQSSPFEGFYCAGTLVGWKWVLTAAHCTYENNPKNKTLPPVEMTSAAIQVYVASRDFSGGERIAVQRIVRNSYDVKTQDNDIALLELSSEPKNKKGLQRVKLLAANDDEPTTPGRYATAIGWGATADKNSSNILQVVDVQAKPTESCNRFYVDHLRTLAKMLYKRQNASDDEVEDIVNKRFPLTKSMVTPHMMCAGSDIRAADTCFGDSGGPLLVKRGEGYAQAGIVSWGPIEGCGIANLYGVYTRTSHYIDWINEQTK
jgi:secreted trypsin-like serine protease